MGAPVVAYTRISDEPIEVHSGVYTPDIVVVIDPTLLGVVPVTSGLKEGGVLIVNSPESPEVVRERLKAEKYKVASVNATKIALDVFGRAFFNTPMLGAMVKVTGLVSLESLKKAVHERFKGAIAEKNIEAIERAYNEVVTT